MDTQAITEPAGSELPPLNEVWARVFTQVRRDVDIPTVWLAMQAVQPLAVDGSFFVAALPATQKYLATNLQGYDASTAIEEALREVTGRILAFRLIEGETLEDWEQEKAKEQAARQTARTAAPKPPPAAPTPPPVFEEPTFDAPTFNAPAYQAAPAPRTPRPSSREVIPSWDKLNEKLSHGYKSAPYVKYAHGQARYLLRGVMMISDTMDALMPPGQAHDDTQERLLAKTIERFGSVINLDPLFVSLELMRFRLSEGKETDLL